MFRYRPAFAALALLMLSATATPAAAQTAAPDPAQQAADAALAAATASAPRFDPATRTCQNEPAERDGRRWATAVPLVPAHPASVVALGLSGGAWNQPVTLTVTAPDGEQRVTTDVLAQSGRISLSYPIRPALPGPESRVPGAYTAVWTDTAWGTFLACDGFVVER